ncbi:MULTISPECIES: ABC transporter permease [unclassified Streptomyces]|uniref:ABC transporter permease n=1 Tax=unclassified Streptomyces TaxID=2593676 RepID=UPI0036E2E623
MSPRRAAGSGALGRPALSRRTTALVGVAVYAVLLVAWEIYGRGMYHPGGVLPPPSRILGVLWDDRAAYARNTWATVGEAAAGFAAGVLLAVLLAVFMDRFRAVGDGLHRLALMLYSIPVIGLAPALVAWLGLGFTSKAVVALLAAFFPVLVNLVGALRSTDPRVRELGMVLGLGSPRELRYLRLPYALPAFVASLKIAAPAAFIGAMIAEWVGADQGLGLALLYAMFGYQIPQMWAALALSTAVTGLLAALFGALARIATPWHASVGPTGERL